MSKSTWAIVIVVILILIVAGFLVLGRTNTTSEPTATVSPAATQTTEITPSPSAVAINASSSAETASSSASAVNLTVSGTEYSYSPKVLTAKVGQPVTVTFKNDGTYPHNFTISELKVASKTIQPGQSTTVTFTPTKAGEYKFFCSVDSHEAKGMVGTLTVQ